MMTEFKIITDKYTGGRVLYVPYLNGLKHGFINLKIIN
jgi:hypothetical protein